MKKTLFAIALIALITDALYAQGTIAFGNSFLTRITIRNLDGSLRGYAKASDQLTFAVFFGPAGTTAPDALTQVHQPAPVATIGATDGVMINAPSVFALPGTQPGQVVSLQIRGWDAATGGQFMFGQTELKQVTLQPTSGPGMVIWTPNMPTHPNRFSPLIIYSVPEPSPIALAMLGVAGLLLVRRRA